MAGSISKRKDGRWQGSYQYSLNGKTIRKYVYSSKHSECLIKLYRLIDKIDQEKEG